MFGPVEPKKRKQKTSGRAVSSQQQPKGSSLDQSYLLQLFMRECQLHFVITKHSLLE